MARTPPPKVPPRGGRSQQGPADDGEGDKFNVDVPDGELERYFVFGNEDEAAAPSKEDEEDLERFQHFLAAADADESLPDGARALLDAKDLDSLWALWTHSITAR